MLLGRRKTFSALLLFLRALKRCRYVRALGVGLLCFPVTAALLSSAAAQVVFTDDFDTGAATCDTLSPNWTTTSTNLSGIDTFTANSNSCALFTRGDAVSVTSIAVDLSSAVGADLTAWVRKGADTFSEDPDTTAENLVIEYSDATGFFFVLQEFDATALADGAVTNVNLSLPFAALHANTQFRVRQLGGSGGPPANGGLGWDFWHIDDFVITQTATPPPPPPPPTLTANSCDDFEGGALNNWIASNTTRVGINSDTSNSLSNSLFLRHDTATATSVAVNGTGLVEVTAWIRRGSDAFSENPDAGENLTLEFLDASNNWIALETFPGGGTQGEIFTRTYTATAAFRHPNFRLRFSYSNGSGSDFDYWHVDDVCLVSGAPNLMVSKTVLIESDPVSPPSGPQYAIPGAQARYMFTFSNTGIGVVDSGTIVLDDTLDSNIALFVGDLDGGGSPFVFTDGTGANASGLSLNFGSLADPTDGVIFRDSGNNIITPTGPYDDSVASFELIFDGQMNGAGGGGVPTFTVEYRVQVD